MKKVVLVSGGFDPLHSGHIAHFITEAGIEFEYADPLTGNFFQPYESTIFLMAHNAKITYLGTGVDVHQDAFYCAIPPGSIIVDPWRTLPDMYGVKVIHYGNPKKTK